MTGPVTVHVVLSDDEEIEAGTLRTHASGRNESATFTYAEALLADRRAYASPRTDAAARQPAVSSSASITRMPLGPRR